MIGDVSRTGTYRKAILGNAAVAIKDKVVLDVGAGMSCCISWPVAIPTNTRHRLRHPVVHGGTGGRKRSGRARGVIDGGQDADRELARPYA